MTGENTEMGQILLNLPEFLADQSDFPRFHAVLALTDSVTSLVEDLLKLPEGKLVTSKSKQQALKWLSTLAPAANPPRGDR